MQAYDNDACDDAVLAEDAFARSRAAFAELAATLGGAEAGGWTHDQLEDHLERDGRQLLRRLLQDHLDLRALREQHAVQDALTAAGWWRSPTPRGSATARWSGVTSATWRRCSARCGWPVAPGGPTVPATCIPPTRR